MIPTIEQFLIIEDNSSDCHILTVELEKLGYSPTKFNCVVSLAELTGKLPNLHPTLIFCDLNIVDSEGIDTFQVVQKYFPTIPIIIITGLEDETLAMQAIKLGAEDYLKKSQYDILLLNKTIRFALERARYRKHSVKIEREKEFEQRDKEALINNTIDLIWSIDTNMRLVAGNVAFISSLEKSIGITLVRGDNILVSESFPPEFTTYWKAIYTRALAGESLMEESYIPPTPGMLEGWTEISFNPIILEGSVVGVACYGRNITERKNTEKELSNLHKQLKKRVAELALSNTELLEIAWMQSHVLRAPLARIMGLSGELNEGNIEPKTHELLAHLKDAATELDRIIKEIITKAERVIPPVENSPVT